MALEILSEDDLLVLVLQLHHYEGVLDDIRVTDDLFDGVVMLLSEGLEELETFQERSFD